MLPKQSDVDGSDGCCSIKETNKEPCIKKPEATPETTPEETDVNNPSNSHGLNTTANSEPNKNEQVLVSCAKKGSTLRRSGNQIPSEILDNEELKAGIKFSLPPNYEFEIPKSLWRIQQERSQHVGLQFPEGLLIFASQIAALLKHFTPWPIEITILADVTYGACCIDDLTSRSIGIDLLIHYGHSCLVPIHQTVLKCLYVFVDIIFDFKSLVNAVTNNFPIRQQNSNPSVPSQLTESELTKSQMTLSQRTKSELTESQSRHSPSLSSPSSHQTTNIPSTTESPPSGNPNTSLIPSPSLLMNDVHYDGSPVIVLLGTIQYSSVLHAAAHSLRDVYGVSNIIVPQELPLTAGEVLGCTSPTLTDSTNFPTFVIFISDGRFHLESAMIQNPSLPFFRYDPFTKVCMA